MDWRDRISIDPAIHHGKPCIKGTRVPVSVIVGTIAEGHTPARIIKSRSSRTLPGQRYDSSIAAAAEERRQSA